jgi:hypothetical protein
MSQELTCNADLNQFRDWVNEDPVDRVCVITLSTAKDHREAVWVYSRMLNASQYVDSVSDIDLIAADEQRRLLELMWKHPAQARALLESVK